MKREFKDYYNTRKKPSVDRWVDAYRQYASVSSKQQNPNFTKSNKLLGKITACDAGALSMMTGTKEKSNLQLLSMSSAQ